MKVLVVGAGPAGAVTALLLARCGVGVTLVERESSFERVFRGEGLMPLGVDALLKMGLGGVLGSIPGRRVESWNIWIDGEEVFVIPEPVEELGERAVRVVSQPALLEKMVEEASRYPSFSFEQGTRVHDLIHERDGRVVGAELRTDDGAREVRANLVIGTDGRGSLVRTRAGLQLELLPEQYDVLWFKLPAPEALREGCSFMIAVAAKQHPAICYTSWDGRLQYGLVMPKDALKEMREKDWVSESVRSAPGWLAEHVLAKRDEIEGPTRLNVLVGRCREWTVPGMLLLGDAAHPMSPVRAQGINLALRDAIVAANHLVPVLENGAEPGALHAAVPSRAGGARARNCARPEAPEPGGRGTGRCPLRELALRVRQARGPPARALPLGPKCLAHTESGCRLPPMSTGTHREDRSPAEELRRRYRGAKDPVERSHHQIAWLLAEGKSAREAAEATGYGERWVREVARRYRERGAGGLGDRRHRNPGGAGRALLTPEQQEELGEALKAPPEDGGLWSSRKVAEWIEERTGRRGVRAPQRG